MVAKLSSIIDKAVSIAIRFEREGATESDLAELKSLVASMSRTYQIAYDSIETGASKGIFSQSQYDALSASLGESYRRIANLNQRVTALGPASGGTTHPNSLAAHIRKDGPAMVKSGMAGGGINLADADAIRINECQIDTLTRILGQNAVHGPPQQNTMALYNQHATSALSDCLTAFLSQ